MKKLLIATSALTLAAPAFAEEYTLSGTFAGKASTEGGDQLSGGVITTLTFGVTYKGDNVGGDFSFGDTDSDLSLEDITGMVESANIYAETSFGKFNFGTDDGYKTDDDLTELEFFNDETGKNVDFKSGLTAFKAGENVDENKTGVETYLTYSNSFEGVGVALTWADDGYVLSAGGDFAGYSVGLDMSTYTGESEEDPAGAGTYVLNVSGDVGPVALALEMGYAPAVIGNDIYTASESEDGATDLKLGYSFGLVDVNVGVGSDEVNEILVSGDAGDIGYKVAFGSDGKISNEDNRDFSLIGLTSTVADMEAGLEIKNYNAVDTTELYIKPIDDFEIEFVDKSSAEDPVINFKISTSF